MIEWRWATAVAYHRRWQPDTWRRHFKLEDFWTRHLRELQQAQEPRLEQAELMDNKIRGIVAKEKTTFTLPRQLLYAVIGLQWVTVAFSKACWFVSLMIFHSKVMGKFLSFILSKHDMHAFEDYSKYKETLTDVQMLKRSPQSLWVANRKSITKAKKLILQGNEDGPYMCETLVEFLANKPQTELKYLCKKRSIKRTPHRQEASDLEKQQAQEKDKGSLAVEEHLTDVGTKSWKMTAVSLLSVIVHLSSKYGESDKKQPHTAMPCTSYVTLFSLMMKYMSMNYSKN
ncbi:hypothetical protein SUGI_0850460 [Cryptomeria japonica]|nr:hypothetical protein SUGI_0850460 [Cryptomeria japonica]